MITQYRTISAHAQGEYKDKGSKFLAFAYPVATEEEIKAWVALLRKEHVKSRHICYAFRIGTDNVLERSNDDGEPSGTAGKPILGQIHSLNLTHVMVAVVRYFGGTLLGVPGLIAAYKGATVDALNNAAIIEKQIDAIYDIVTDYVQFHEVMNYLKRESVTVTKQLLQEQCNIEVAIHPDLKEKFRQDMETKFGIIVNFKYHA